MSIQSDNRTQQLVAKLAKLFPNVDDMSQLDAADFKDKASEIWDLHQQAKKIVLDNV